MLDDDNISRILEWLHENWETVAEKVACSAVVKLLFGSGKNSKNTEAEVAEAKRIAQEALQKASEAAARTTELEKTLEQERKAETQVEP